MTTNNKTLYMIIIVAVLAAVAGGTYWYMQNQGNNIFAPYSTTQNNGASSNMSYGDMVKLYVNRRIQFDESCELVPNTVTYKAGTTIMLDNRSSKKTVIGLDNTDYNISAYGYTLVTLTSPSLPHTFSIDCGKGQNNGQIILQK